MKPAPIRCAAVLLSAFAGIAGAPAPAPAAAEPERVFHVRDFGAQANDPGDSGAAIRAAIRAAVASGTGAELVFDAGTYRVAPQRPRGHCLPVAEADGLHLRGAKQGTHLVFTDPISSGIAVLGGRGVVVTGLTLDYDPLPFCQGTVRAVDVEAGHFDLEIEEGYPTPDGENFVRAIEPYGKWGMIMDRAARRIKAGTPDHYMTPRWEHREGRLWRFFTASEHVRRQLARMEVGDAYVHLGRGHGSAVLARGCDDVRIENVVVHAAPALAVGLVGNRGAIVVRGLEVRFPPETTRLLTTNADGVHCQQNRSGPVIEDCYFEGMADDGINIYAPPNVVHEVRRPAEWLISAGCQVLPGDRLQVFDPRAGRIRGSVRALEVRQEGRALLLVLEEPLAGVVAGEDYRSADTLYNLDACGAGFRIRENHFRGHRRYGCLLRAGQGTVEGNLFDDTTGAGVVLTNEPDWPEGPVPWDVTVRGNRFLRGGTCLGYADSPHGAALAVRGARLGHATAEGTPLRGITIEGNEFLDRPGAAIYVGGAQEVVVRENRIVGTAGAELRRAGGAVVIEQSRRVLLADNQVIDPRTGVTAAVEIRGGTAPGEEGVRIEGLAASLGPEARAVEDHRPQPEGARGRH